MIKIMNIRGKNKKNYINTIHYIPSSVCQIILATNSVFRNTKRTLSFLNLLVKQFLVERTIQRILLLLLIYIQRQSKLMLKCLDKRDSCQLEYFNSQGSVTIVSMKERIIDQSQYALRTSLLSSEDLQGPGNQRQKQWGLHNTMLW